MQTYYDDGNGIVIYHGDCREVLPTLTRGCDRCGGSGLIPSDPMFDGPTPYICPKIGCGGINVDFLLTDPPYEMVASGGGIGAKRDYLHDIEDFTDCGFDVDLLTPFKSWACFCAKVQLQKLIAATGGRRWMLVTWNKPNPTPLSNGNYLPDTEYIVHAFAPKRLFGEFRDKSRFIVHPVEKNGFGHPNVKPIPVIAKMIRLGTIEGDLILDPFMGSGTTLRAAKDLGRKCIGIEIEERYCEIAARRLEQNVFAFTDSP